MSEFVKMLLGILYIKPFYLDANYDRKYSSKELTELN